MKSGDKLFGNTVLEYTVVGGRVEGEQVVLSHTAVYEHGFRG